MPARGTSAKDDKPVEGKVGHKVTAPLIAVKVGEQVLQYHSGDVLPGGVDKETLERLSDLGFIAEL